MKLNNYNIQIGHIVRHSPSKAGSQGSEAALIDIAQDLLFIYLNSINMFDSICLKGGTAIRKLYAGKQGRFSIDLDFTTVSTKQTINEVEEKFINAVDGLKIEDFRYYIKKRRNRYYVGFTTKFIDSEILKTKLDFSAPSWIKPIYKNSIDMPIHHQYGIAIPKIYTVQLEENIAEKIARLNRTTTARDLYDLNWIMNNSTLKTTLDKNLIKRLVVLKIWVDSYGLNCENVQWNKAHEPSKFDPKYWLRDRKENEVDLEDIGALSVPVPKAKDLLKGIQNHYSFLNNLDDTEKIIAESNQKDKSLVIKTLKELPNNIFNNKILY